MKSRFSRSIRGVDPDAFGGWDRVVVTGGTGCIGTAVLNLLTQAGVPELISVANEGPTERRTVGGVRYLYGDITNRGEMETLFCNLRPDLVVHLAGIREPGLAERRVVDAVEVNVLGTEIVMQASAKAGVSVAVAASTGKAMRLFTSDVYASSKQLLEYEVARAGELTGMRTGSARFTHVVDNSLIYNKLLHWASSGRPITLHAPDVDFYVQSAREAAELLILTARIVYENPQSGWVTALADLGWPPIDLLGLAMDVVEERKSSSPIVVVGFPPGYENLACPETVDPLTAGDHSPLFNALEAARSCTPPGCSASIDASLLPPTTRAVDDSLRSLERSVSSRSPVLIRDRLAAACRNYLKLKLETAPAEVVRAMAQRSESRFIGHDHRVVRDLIDTRLSLEPAFHASLESLT